MINLTSCTGLTKQGQIFFFFPFLVLNPFPKFWGSFSSFVPSFFSSYIYQGEEDVGVTPTHLPAYSRF